MAKEDTLLFIPDISGFTNFVTNTATSHGKHIITELLELLVDQNQLKLEISEIEGDAIFFYRKGSLPTIKELLEQAKSMFLAFHNHLKLYETQRICQCGACSSSFDLTLKIIVHSGDVEEMEISSHKKLYGNDVILAHRLLKNNIDENEYLLVTNDLFASGQNSDTIPQKEVDEWVAFKQKRIEYSNLPEVSYHYTSLSRLRKWIGEPSYNQIFKKSTSLVRMQTNISLEPEVLYELISNFKYRKLWNHDVQTLEYDKSKINRQGEKHVCVINGKRINFESTSGDSSQKKLVYGEKTKDVPIGKDLTLYFIIEKDEESEGGSKLVMEFHFTADSFISKLMTPLLKMRLKKSLTTLMDNIKTLKPSDLETNTTSQLELVS